MAKHAESTEQADFTINQRLPSFGARLRRLRRACGIKQAYVAQIAGVDQATVSRWERGITQPAACHAQAIIQSLQPQYCDDSSLKRLVENSRQMVHLITDVDHRLLAASSSRETVWQRSVAALIGRSVWGAASPAIQSAEAALESQGWWEYVQPAPVEINLDAYHGGFLPIIPGRMLWERMWLSDGRPARLCTLIQIDHGLTDCKKQP